jgi:hypothetical protein
MQNSTSTKAIKLRSAPFTFRSAEGLVGWIAVLLIARTCQPTARASGRSTQFEPSRGSRNLGGDSQQAQFAIKAEKSQ